MIDRFETTCQRGSCSTQIYVGSQMYDLLLVDYLLVNKHPCKPGTVDLWTERASQVVAQISWLGPDRMGSDLNVA
jgi:hypothetical protein